LVAGLCLTLSEDDRGHDSSAFGAELAGTAQVIDGDTISLAGAQIRLWGIGAPERDQTCQRKNGDVYGCGRDSAAVLSELTPWGEISVITTSPPITAGTTSGCSEM
jgi:endonuclease YncB( thermonuclease family)